MSDSAYTICCIPSLTIKNSQTFLSDIKQIISNINKLTKLIIDISSIEEIDTAGMQLLIAIKKTAEQLGISLNWQGTSEEVEKKAKLLGLNNYIQN